MPKNIRWNLSSEGSDALKSTFARSNKKGDRIDRLSSFEDNKTLQGIRSSNMRFRTVGDLTEKSEKIYNDQCYQSIQEIKEEAKKRRRSDGEIMLVSQKGLGGGYEEAQAFLGQFPNDKKLREMINFGSETGRKERQQRYDEYMRLLNEKSGVGSSRQGGGATSESEDEQPPFERPSFGQPSYEPPFGQPPFERPSFGQPSYEPPFERPSFGQPSYEPPFGQPSYEPSEYKRPQDGAYVYFDNIIPYTPGPGETQMIHHAELRGGGACVVNAIQMELRRRGKFFPDWKVANQVLYQWGMGGSEITQIPFAFRTLGVSKSVKYEENKSLSNLQSVLRYYGRPVIVGLHNYGEDKHVLTVNNIETDAHGNPLFVRVSDSNSLIGHYKVDIHTWMKVWERNYVYFKH